MQSIIYLFLGGGLGALSRYGVSVMMTQWLGAGFPFGTVMVNLLGSFILGALVGLTEVRFDGVASNIPPAVRYMAMIGFLGAFTTFSTFEMESYLMFKEGQLFKLALNLVGSVFAGFFLVWLGYNWGRWFFSNPEWN